MNAYITLLSTLNYLPGVLVLHESLCQVGAAYPLHVAVSKNIPGHVDALLAQRGMAVIRLPAPIEIPAVFQEKSGHWNYTFDKLHLFGLTQFDKLVYLDSDMMVLANIDELFARPHMSAVAAGRMVHPDWRRLNSGLMVIVPERSLPEKISATLHKAITEVQALGSQYLGDQDLINAYYNEWPYLKNLHLDDGYNMFYSEIDVYLGKHGYALPPARAHQGRLVRIVHFVGPHKPWMPWAEVRFLFNTFRKETPAPWERTVFRLYRGLLKKSGVSQTV